MSAEPLALAPGPGGSTDGASQLAPWEWDRHGAGSTVPAPEAEPEVSVINPLAYSKWPLERFIQAAQDGDLGLLSKMLDREDPVDGYHHDMNQHLAGYNALHAAAMNGQTEAVQLLLNAKADPHVRKSVLPGREPMEGETARELADKWGWDDIVEILSKAEHETPKGLYKRYGANNNAKLWPVSTPEGLDPEQEKRARQRHKGMLRPLPNRPDRKFYGDQVYGVTFGWDRYGKVIKTSVATAAAVAGPGADREVAAPAKTQVGLLFPGLGSQHSEMLSGAERLPWASDMLAVANRVLGYNLPERCQGQLDRADICFAGGYVADVLAAELLRRQQPEVVEKPGALAGLLMGEYAALTIAGVFTFEVGLQLVKVVSEALAAAAANDQAIMSVAGLDRSSLKGLCDDVQARTSQTCQITNELFPNGFTCGGTRAAITELKGLLEKKGALQMKVLEVPCAFHTKLMEPARAKLQAALLKALPDMKPPGSDIYMNATGKVLPQGSQPAAIIPLMCDQLTSAALWEASVRGMLAAGIQDFYEVGPRTQLKSMMKRIDAEAWSRTQSIEL